MPTYVDPNKCDGCRGLARTACMYICPNDLMKYDADLGKAFNKDHGMAFNQEPDACWECFSCVKACPQGAIVSHLARSIFCRHGQPVDHEPLGFAVEILRLERVR